MKVGCGLLIDEDGISFIKLICFVIRQEEKVMIMPRLNRVPKTNFPIILQVIIVRQNQLAQP
jgi:hypothetical protein